MTGKNQEIVRGAFSSTECNLRGKDQSENFIIMSGKIKESEKFGVKEKQKSQGI